MKAKIRKIVVQLDETHLEGGRAVTPATRRALAMAKADVLQGLAGEAFAAAVGTPMRHWDGGHTAAYWHAHYARYLRFYAEALANCG